VDGTETTNWNYSRHPFNFDWVRPGSDEEP
jgi:hypothetical protein